MTSSVSVLQDKVQLESLFDMDLEATPICVDGMSSEDIRLLVQGDKLPVVAAAADQPALPATTY